MQSNSRKGLYLIDIDSGLPKVVSLLVKVSHPNLSKVTRMVLVQVRSVMMLSTSKTSPTRMLPVLPYTTVSCGDMAATITNKLASIVPRSRRRLDTVDRHPKKAPKIAKRHASVDLLLAGFRQVGRHCQCSMPNMLSFRTMSFSRFSSACPKCALASLTGLINLHRMHALTLVGLGSIP